MTMTSSELISGNQLATSAPDVTDATASHSRTADRESWSSCSTARSVASGSVASSHRGHGRPRSAVPPGSLSAQRRHLPDSSSASSCSSLAATVGELIMRVLWVGDTR
ncbi:hypothetical protein [Corallococcus llansteffanensis]|uniref:hypothetical protein n=1 Tax=Corallococcus llansteffanensis TaxID=2316731 RepID=UPI00142EEF87|nr:hypothetical protein [Corallococcus llansteffanensis]